MGVAAGLLYSAVSVLQKPQQIISSAATNIVT
jgi:hypothetical protein